MGNQDDRKYLYDHQLVINMSTWCHKYYRSPSTCYCLKQSFSCSINDSLSKYFEIYFRFYPNVIINNSIVLCHENISIAMDWFFSCLHVHCQLCSDKTIEKTK